MEELLRRLWADETVRTSDIALRLGISMSSLYRVVSRLKLPSRLSNPHLRSEEDPSPEEILQRAEEIRSTWTAKQTRRRTPTVRWVPPEYNIDARGLRISH